MVLMAVRGLDIRDIGLPLADVLIDTGRESVVVDEPYTPTFDSICHRRSINLDQSVGQPPHRHRRRLDERTQ
uniref:Transposase n=1 Tax=Panagrellus redivivus TaxID=6233 RepID=A0A7E4ZQZ1_PANRE